MTRIYVACLAAYNSGRLHGEWIDDLDMFDAEEVSERIASMLKRSPAAGAEEWAIHDHEGFGSIRIAECHDLAELCAVARLIAEHGLEVADAALDHADADDAETWVAENYEGEYGRVEDWAESWLDDTGSLMAIPENLRSYFDFTAWARDAELSGDIYTAPGKSGVHVFFSR